MLVAQGTDFDLQNQEVSVSIDLGEPGVRPKPLDKIGLDQDRDIGDTMLFDYFVRCQAVDSLTRLLGSSLSRSLNCSEKAFCMSFIISSMSGNPHGLNGEPFRLRVGHSSPSSSSKRNPFQRRV